MTGIPALDLLISYEAAYTVLADGFGHSRLRFLLWLRDLDYWEDDDEPHDVGHLVCVLCGTGPIEPGTVRETGPRFTEGLTRHFINDQPVTRAEFERRRTAARAAVATFGPWEA